MDAKPWVLREKQDFRQLVLLAISHWLPLEDSTLSLLLTWAFFWECSTCLMQVSLVEAYGFTCRAHVTDSKCCKRLDLVWNFNSVYKKFIPWCCLPHYVSNSAWLFSQLSSMGMWNQVSRLAENYERYYCSYPVKPSSYLIVPLPLQS